MALKLNTGPAIEPIDLDEMKTHLRIDSEDYLEDDYIESLIEAARRACEVDQGRAYINQTWELWLDSWPGGDTIVIPKPPLSSITSIKYYDTDDTEATFSSSSYFVDAKDQYRPRVVLNYGESWPSTTLRPANGICVTFVAGYGTGIVDVPSNIRNAILLLAAHLYENREAVMTSGMNAAELPLGVRYLLDLERVY